MKDTETLKAAMITTRTWRQMEVGLLDKTGCKDLSYRPRSGMSSIGWVLAHQAAVYDYTLNVLIKQASPQNSELFQQYTPGTSGDWNGTSPEEIQAYFESSERALLEWIERAKEVDLERVINDNTVPSFFFGMTVREVLMNTFTHLSYHTGHLTAIRRDWIALQNDQENI
jgi:uncharacterized damage-inducible protein DinB